MFNWAKQTLANVAGTQEPIYGPSAIRSVAVEAEKKPYTELSRDHMKWQSVGSTSTSVETQSFYIMSDEGRLALAQVIYSNVAGIHTTCQFNCKIFSREASKPHLWSASPLSNADFSEDKTSFYADDCAVELSDDGNSYTIKSMNDQKALVNLKITREAPAFHVGETGKTLYGTDLSNPWGSMRHAFWPRCVSEGTITTEEGPINFQGKALYSHALQGMKPHHAAARWNFADFQGPNYSAILMQYTTPASYGSTVVSVGGIAKKDQIVTAGAGHTVTHTAVNADTENDWPEPTSVKFEWTGKSSDGQVVDALIEGPIGPRVDKVDVMAEVPGFVKKIVAGAAGTKPYIYQYSPTVTLKLRIGDEEITEEGRLFSEATFILEEN